MKSLYKILTPSFLQKIDHYLLTHYPVLWSTKVHFWGFYSLIVTNLGACIGGISYPLAVNRIPAYDHIFEIWRWSFGLAVGVLLYYAYNQRHVIRQVFSLKEVLLRVSVYLFCTASLFFNTWVFPQIIFYRVTQIIPKNEFYADLKSFALEVYLDKMVQSSFYNHAYDHLESYWETEIHEAEDTLSTRKLQKMVRYPKYRDILLKSWFNRDKTVEKHFALCHTLDSLLPKPSHEEMQNYNRRKMELEAKINKPHMNQSSVRVKLRYWEVYEHLNPYKKRVEQFIMKNPDWQPDFKMKLLQEIKNLEEFIFSLEEDFGYYAPLFMQSEKFIALQKKYVSGYGQKFSLQALYSSFYNIFLYQHQDFFFQSLARSHDFSSYAFFNKIDGEHILSKMRSKGRHRMPVQFDPFTGAYWIDYNPDHLITKNSEPEEYPHDIDNDLNLKINAFNYYLDEREITQVFSEELPQQVSLPEHHLLEAYFTLWLTLSLLILVAHTLSIPRLALVSAFCIGFYKIHQIFLFAYINRMLRYFGEDWYAPWASYLGFLIPSLLIFLSLVGLFYYRFMAGNYKWLYWVFGLASVTSLWAGIWIFAEMLFPYDLKQNDWAFNYTICLYLILFLCNLNLYWRYIQINNYPKYNP